MKVSVIIPAYNAEATLAACLRSVDGSGAEIIVVDDGSVDGTTSITAEFHDAIVVRQTNRGVSAARNVGIDRARGEYLVFLDADDTLMDHAVELLSKALDTERPDIVVMRSFGSESENYPWSGLFPDGTVCTKQSLVCCGYVRGSVCGCAFRKAYLQENGLSFGEGISLSEDLVFMSASMSAGGNVLFRDIPFYQVRLRQDSASRMMDPDYFRRYSLALDAAAEQIGDTALYTATCRSIILGMIHLAAPVGYSPSRLWKEACLDRVLPLPVVPGIRHRFEIRLMNFCFPLYFHLKHLRDLCRHR